MSLDDEAEQPTLHAEQTELGEAPTLLSQQTQPSATDAPRRLPRGAQIGRYVVLEILGQGGMGVVYAAYDPQLDRRIAIKLLRPSRASGERGKARLLREAQAIARISHPNVVAVHDVGAEGESVFVAMEFVDGETLTAWLARVKPDPAQLLEMLIQAGRGLAAAHGAGIVHRDFKPDNVLVGRDGRARVLDFGLARGQPTAESMVDGEAVSASGSGSLASWSQLDNDLTREGAVMGTPAYMSPEQHLGQLATPASDQFAFCIVLYQGLYGYRPFDGNSVRDLAKATLRGKVKAPPSGTKVPADLHAVIVRGLSPKPSERYPTMAALLRELARDRRTSTRRWVAGLGLVAVVGVTAGLSYVGGTRREPTPCQNTDETIASVWTAPRRQAIAAAFSAAAGEPGSESWSRAEPVVDAYVQRWKAQQYDACAATRIGGTQSEHMLDRRTVCLSNRATHLDALLESFGDPTPRLVEQALGLAHALPDLADCAEQGVATGVAPPATQEIQAKVDEADEALAWAEARASAGRIQDVIDRLTPWLAEAERLGYLPLVARLRHRLGRAHASLHHPEGVQMVEQAFVDGLEAGDDRIVMMAGIDTATFLGDDERRPGEALRVLDVVDAVIRRAQPRDGSMRVGAATARAVIYVRQGRYTEAGELFRQALAYQEADDPRGPNTVVALQNLGGFYAERRRLALALQLHERALALAEELYGPDHSSHRELYQNLGILHFLRQQYEPAKDWLERTLQIQTRVLGPEHPDLARTLGILGVVTRHLGDLEEAERLQTEALRLFEPSSARGTRRWRRCSATSRSRSWSAGASRRRSSWPKARWTWWWPGSGRSIRRPRRATRPWARCRSGPRTSPARSTRPSAV